MRRDEWVSIGDAARQAMRAYMASMQRLDVSLDRLEREHCPARCRVAYIVDGAEGYAPWKDMSEYESLAAAAKQLMAGNPAVEAWVERR